MNELVRMISEDGTLYVLAVNSTEMVQEMQNIHQISKVCSAALGRLITAAGMMGVLLKGDKDTLTIKMNGSGPASPVVAVANSKGQVKGYVIWSKSSDLKISQAIPRVSSIERSSSIP